MGRPPATARPHLVMALLDDLGWAGVGFNSPTGEPLTPTIDGLRREGLLLRRHYAFHTCSPSRSSLLSGRLPLHVTQRNLGGSGQPGGGIPEGMTTLGTLLKRQGYATHHIGKWHCGMTSAAQLPVRRGFDTSFAVLPCVTRSPAPPERNAGAARAVA